MYLYLLYNKSETLDVFKIHKSKGREILSKQIKIIRYRSREYYGRHAKKR